MVHPAISGGKLEGFVPKIGSLQILETTKSTLLLEAKINITNPTEYSATVPYVNVNFLNNGTILGHATARDVSVVPGPNHNIVVQALWEPMIQSGKKGADVGRELLSQYISGTFPSSRKDRASAHCRRLQHDPHREDSQRHHPHAATSRSRPLVTRNRNTDAEAYTTSES